MKLVSAIHLNDPDGAPAKHSMRFKGAVPTWFSGVFDFDEGYAPVTGAPARLVSGTRIYFEAEPVQHLGGTLYAMRWVHHAYLSDEYFETVILMAQEIDADPQTPEAVARNKIMRAGFRYHIEAQDVEGWHTFTDYERELLRQLLNSYREQP